MSEAHPEILYQVQQMRLHELRERAATARVAAQLTPAWGSQWQQSIKQLRVYLTKVGLLLSSPAQKPAPNCC